MTKQQNRKKILRNFMREHYTDERLTMLLAHAKDGKLAYISCCCFIGIPTADHALRTHQDQMGDHLDREPYMNADEAYNRLYQSISGMISDIHDRDSDYRDIYRRRIIIPIIRAEMKRREKSSSITVDMNATVQQTK